ncbi:MAG TPA: phytanoyl-CoA dioxygenase family protein [Patescibacteria group bacterium]|nr:phytanoyl-CoA dioxygenase family protein [Patescibacteria group bacterium]
MSQSGIVLEALARLRQLKREAERVEAKVRFSLQRKQRLSPLSEEQTRQYHRDGYLLVSGLIPSTLVSEAVAAIWEGLGVDPRAPETWGILGPHSHVIRDDRLIATYTDAMLAAAAQLAGEDVARFRLPTHAFTINRQPVSKPWESYAAHIDRTIPEWRYRTFPRPYWIGAMTYLTNVQSQGGGTMVWPGSHLELEALARANPGKYKYLAALTPELGRVTRDAPVEVTPSQGDVLFHHYLFVHASSDNIRGTPRLAINHKW